MKNSSSLNQEPQSRLSDDVAYCDNATDHIQLRKTHETSGKPLWALAKYFAHYERGYLPSGSKGSVDNSKQKQSSRPPASP